jgi:PhoH-like ATPase
MRKNYILDANILIHDPNSLFQFADNAVIIPIGVISEIDRFKKEATARGYNARAVARMLDALRGSHSLADGVPLEGGGVLRVHCDPEQVMHGSNGAADTEILHAAKVIQQGDRETPVIIVTKDINLRIRADAAGLKAEDYESDRVMLTDVYTGQLEFEVPQAEIHRFKEEGHAPLPKPNLIVNEYIHLRADDGSRVSALARVAPDGSGLIPLHEAPEGVWGIRPRNKEQYFALDALLDDSLQLITIMGKAGTGKTLLAMAAMIQLSMRQRRFRCGLVARPIMPVGRDLGFLPGDVGQKLAPWMKPVVDTIEFLIDVGGPVAGYTDCEHLIDSGLIEIQPLTYIRGRNISKRFVVIDEAQNLTPLEVKTVITRIGQGAKIVLTGDPYQIDNPYVDANSNGFTFLINRFRAQPLAAHIELRKGERSPLAELAANLL